MEIASSTLKILFLGAAGIASCMLFAWCFRFALQSVLPQKRSKIVQNMPLSASLGIAILLIYAVVAIFAPAIAPFGENEIVADEYLPWSREFVLGTDNLGRDMFSRLIYGARNTVGIAFVTTVIAFIFGTFLGLFAAAKGGFLDGLLSRLVDLLIAIPSLIFALLLLTIFGTSLVSMVLVVALIEATRVYRLARAVAMNIVVMDFVEVAKLRGDGLVKLTVIEILPNAAAPLIAEFGLRFCFTFLAISAISFLGLGIQPPTADWGSMVRDNAPLMSFGDLIPLLPAAAISILTIGVNFVVDWTLHLASGLKDR